MSSAPSETTTTTRADIPGFAKGPLTRLATQAGGLLSNRRGLVSDLSPDTLAAQEALRQGGQPGGFFNQAQTSLEEIARTGGFSDQFFGDLQDRFTNTTGANINALFSDAGRFGSGAQQDTISRAFAQELAPFFINAQQQATGNRLAAIGQAPQLQQATTGIDQQNIQNLLLSGQISEDQANALLSEPFDRLSLLSPIITGAAGFSGQTTTQPVFRNRAAGALGGAASGASLGSSFGPYGALAGGIIGGGAGFFAS